jgi:hypothetical protein
MLNSINGAGILGLPSLLAAHLGRLVYSGRNRRNCRMSAGSRLTISGVRWPVSYARVCFGPFVAIQIGWLTWLSRILAAASSAFSSLTLARFCLSY